MKLTDLQIRKAKPKEKNYKLSDGAGLHLFVTPAGGKLWRFRYSFGGRERLLSLGPYPDVSIAEARTAKDNAKKLLRTGEDPSLAKKRSRLTVARQTSETFAAIAREWHERQKVIWSQVHANDVLRSLERDVFPAIGPMPIRSVSVPQTLEVLRMVEGRDAGETARRIRQRMSAIFVYAIASGRADADPAAIVQKAMAPLTKGRQPAITDLAAAREILAKSEETPSHPVTKLALRLLAITALRPGTLVQTPWRELMEVSAKNAIWMIPAARMKLRLHMKDDETKGHLVPLPRQALDVIEALRELTGRGSWVFFNTRHPRKPMSENAIGYLLNRAGYHRRHVPHGWRSTFSTVMNERFRSDSNIIELMLAHAPKDKVKGAYDRAAYLERRMELAQLWADLIMDGRPLANDLLKLPMH